MLAGEDSLDEVELARVLYERLQAICERYGKVYRNSTVSKVNTADWKRFQTGCALS